MELSVDDVKEAAKGGGNYPLKPTGKYRGKLRDVKIGDKFSTREIKFYVELTHGEFKGQRVYNNGLLFTTKEGAPNKLFAKLLQAVGLKTRVNDAGKTVAVLPEAWQIEGLPVVIDVSHEHWFKDEGLNLMHWSKEFKEMSPERQAEADRVSERITGYEYDEHAPEFDWNDAPAGTQREEAGWASTDSVEDPWG